MAKTVALTYHGAEADAFVGDDPPVYFVSGGPPVELDADLAARLLEERPADFKKATHKAAAAAAEEAEEA